MQADKSPSVERAEEMLRDPDDYYRQARARAERSVIDTPATRRSRTWLRRWVGKPA